MQNDFTRAAERIQREGSRLKLSQQQQLRLYALYKQATVGCERGSRPGVFNFVGQAKWDSWASLGAMSKDAASQEYISMVKSLFETSLKSSGSRLPQQASEESNASSQHKGESTNEDDDFDDDDDEQDESSGGLSMMGNAVSIILREDEHIADDKKTVWDWTRSGNKQKAMDLANSSNINQLDDEGVGLLHLAIDGNHRDLVTWLLDRGADINLQDADGQTSLHYASICDYPDMARILIDRGADKSIRDSSDALPFDVASSREMKALLQMG